MKTDKFIYVMEFKLDGTAEEALEQINRKHYADAFMEEERTVLRIGINFSSETKNIDKWIVKE